MKGRLSLLQPAAPSIALGGRRRGRGRESSTACAPEPTSLPSPSAAARTSLPAGASHEALVEDRLDEGGGRGGAKRPYRGAGLEARQAELLGDDLLLLEAGRVLGNGGRGRGSDGKEVGIGVSQRKEGGVESRAGTPRLRRGGSLAAERGITPGLEELGRFNSASWRHRDKPLIGGRAQESIRGEGEAEGAGWP